MTGEVTNIVVEALPQFQGYVYPNEASLHPVWSTLIVVYPYITGLVAGAFIMASLVRVFNVKALEPVYRLSMLTALAFLLCATLPLLCHLGHPERCYEIMMTPHLTSPMAIFGFVYAWYLMAVLLLELWFDYRQDFVKWSKATSGFRGILYRALTLGVTDVSEQSVRLDMKMEWILSIVGIPSAFLLHGYVGFIFGSIKANPWWGNVLMPIMFILSAIVSGIALCVFNYIVLTWIRRKTVDMRCLDTMAMFLFYALVVDAVVEGLDVLHRGFAAEEGFAVLQTMIREKLFYTLNVGQVTIGTLLPLLMLGSLQLLRRRVPEAGAAAHDFLQRGDDPDRRAGDALERRHGRPVFLQEPARRDELQNGVCRTGRLAHQRRHYVPAVHHSDGAGETVFVRAIANQRTRAAEQFHNIGSTEKV